MPGDLHQECVQMLVDLGNFLEFKTYSYDHSDNRYYSQENLPETMRLSTLTMVKEIDVIWFKDNFPIFAFEVEITSGVRSAFQRLYQLRHFNCNFFILIHNEADKSNEYKNLYEKLIASDPYYTEEKRFNLLESQDLRKLLTSITKTYKLKKEALGIINEYYENTIEELSNVPDWVDAGASNFSILFTENKKTSQELFEKIYTRFKLEKDDVRLECQQYWISVYIIPKNMIFYVKIRTDRLIFDSKFSVDIQEDLSLEKVERPPSARIIKDTDNYFVVRSDDHLEDIIRLINYSYSKLKESFKI